MLCLLWPIVLLLVGDNSIRGRYVCIGFFIWGGYWLCFYVWFGVYSGSVLTCASTTVGFFVFLCSLLCVCFV